jgi:serine/threonine protein kinase
MKTIDIHEHGDQFDLEKIELIKQLSHPNIIKYYDCFLVPGVSYNLIIEYCEVRLTHLLGLFFIRQIKSDFT